MSVVEFKASLTVDGVDLGAGVGVGRIVTGDLVTAKTNLKLWAGIGSRDIKKNGAEPGYGNFTITEVGAEDPMYDVTGPGEFVIQCAKDVTRAKRGPRVTVDGAEAEQDDVDDTDVE